MTNLTLTDLDKQVAAAVLQSQLVGQDPDTFSAVQPDAGAVAQLLRNCLVWLQNNADDAAVLRVVQDLHEETSQALADQDF